MVHLADRVDSASPLIINDESRLNQYAYLMNYQPTRDNSPIYTRSPTKPRLELNVLN